MTFYFILFTLAVGITKIHCLMNVKRKNQSQIVEAFASVFLCSTCKLKRDEIMVSSGQIIFKTDKCVGKKSSIISVFSRYFPQYNFYWESNRMLAWF